MKKADLLKLVETMPDDAEIVAPREDFLDSIGGFEVVKATKWREGHYAESFYPEADAKDEPVYDLIVLKFAPRP